MAEVHDSLTIDQKRLLVESCPTKVYKLDERTEQVTQHREHRACEWITRSMLCPRVSTPFGPQCTHEERCVRVQVTVARRDKCVYCNECLVVAKTFQTADPSKDRVVTVRPNEERFIFSVEVRPNTTDRSGEYWG